MQQKLLSFQSANAFCLRDGFCATICIPDYFRICSVSCSKFCFGWLWIFYRVKRNLICCAIQYFPGVIHVEILMEFFLIFLWCSCWAKSHYNSLINLFLQLAVHLLLILRMRSNHSLTFSSAASHPKNKTTNLCNILHASLIFTQIEIQIETETDQHI